jgi:hypothetical protein
MNKKYYTIEEAIEMSGLSARDYFSYVNGDLLPEEEILPELFVENIADEEKLIKSLSMR